MKLPTLFHPPAFWYPGNSQENDTFPPAAFLLLPLSRLFTGATRFRRRRARPQSIGIPLVCIGNVTLGGSGKTPLALTLANHFLHQGRNLHFLTRGYGGSTHGPLRVDSRQHNATLVGDEALELAQTAPCWVSRSRLRGALAAKAAGADILLLDDGLQNLHLRYDLAILVLDGERGLGNGCTLPAGPLREPFEDALSHCDLLVTMGELSQPRLCTALDKLEHTNANMLFTARLQPHPMPLPPRVLAFSGIGHPHKLLASLAELGANVIAHRAFPDHHPFTNAEATQLLQDARLLDARLITTRKDALRLTAAPPDSPCARLLQAASILRISAHIEEQERFALCVDTILAARKRKPPNHATMRP